MTMPNRKAMNTSAQKVTVCAEPVKAFEPVVFIQPITTRLPDGTLSIKAGKPTVLNGEDEICSAEAARILGCGIDWVGRLCSRGRLKKGKDWRRMGSRGNYRLKRASIIAYAGWLQKESE